MNSSGEVTQLLVAFRSGEEGVAERLLPLVYDELRSLARRYMRRERPDHTLRPTILAHDAYMRLIDQREKNWSNRAHFFAMAAHLIRLLLIDHAREYNAERRGGGKAIKVTLDRVQLFHKEQFDDLIALDDALTSLAKYDKRMSDVVELRFFAELSVEETAEVLKVSTKTVKRDWKFARAWLARKLNGDREGAHG